MADEVLFSGAEEPSRLTRLVRRGELRRLARGVYTTNLVDASEKVARRNWPTITSHFCPGALIADRSVPIGQPDAQGQLFGVADRVRPVQLPGLTITPRRGPGPRPDDMPYLQGLFISSIPRALVENQRRSRSVKGRPSRTLREAELADWLDSIVRNYDGARVRKFRARAREIAQQFGMTDDGLRADRMIGAALQTRKVTTGSASLAARQSGVPYDTAREPLFDNLHAALDRQGPMTIVAWDEDDVRRETLPFWEAYFSNFIEGTEFTVDEAIGIVYREE